MSKLIHAGRMRLAAFAGVLLAVALVVAAPAAQAANIATTGPATSVTPTQATLHGTVNAGGLSGQYEFQYGTSTSYGAHTTLTQFPAGSQAFDVTAIANGLIPGTTYHYRFVVLLNAQTGPVPGYGADGTFTTPSNSGPPGAIGVPGVAETDGATSITTTSAVLNGKVDPQNIDGVWTFAYGTTAGYGLYSPNPVAPIQGSGPVPVSTKITGLTPGVVYHFRLVVIQGSYPSQTASAGVDVTFVTATSKATGGSSAGGRNPTPSFGVAILNSRTLSVHRGTVSTSWSCRGTSRAQCRGRMKITARGRVHGRMRTVSCGSGSLVASVGHLHIVKGRLSADCETLLKRARRHRLAATLVSTFSTHQTTLRTGVTLSGT